MSDELYEQVSTLGDLPDGKDRARENIRRWGLQDPTILLLAIVEEIAESGSEIDVAGNEPLGADQEGLELFRGVITIGLEVQEYLDERAHDTDGTPLPESERPVLFSDYTNLEQAREEAVDLQPLAHQLRLALDAAPEVNG